tara:strand:- start:17275 stop:17655 length:381 start_codon:yes stop_codon:yes gene_type:complete
MTINVITPPDVLHNQATSILAIQPSEDTRMKLQNVIGETNIAINLYLYDASITGNNIAWMLNIARLADYIIIDLDLLTQEERRFASYLISLPQSFYLTNDETTQYNLLSANRIYDLDWLSQKLTEE